MKKASSNLNKSKEKHENFLRSEFNSRCENCIKKANSSTFYAGKNADLDVKLETCFSSLLQCHGVRWILIIEVICMLKEMWYLLGKE